MMKRQFAAVLLTCGLAGAPAIAQELTFQFTNPSFNGGNSAQLLSIANAQRTATARDANDGRNGRAPDVNGNGMAGDDRADLFVRQLEGRLLSALSSEVTQAIFGDDPQDSGRVEFGDTTITFDRTPESITLNIIDALAGTSTTITVPQLVTSGS